MSVRKYNYKDVDMLIAAETIVNRALSEISFLAEKRPKWKDDFFPSLLQRIQNAYSNYLGIDNALQLREATKILYSIQKPALDYLTEFKIQIERDFNSDKQTRGEILNRLGFKHHYKDAKAKNQEALIELLNKFRQNLSPDLEHQIIEKGMHPDTINRLKDMADNVKNADVTQEIAKGTRKAISSAAVEEFNNIYSEVVSVCKIAALFYKTDSAKKDFFSFAKTVKTLNAAQPKKEETISDPAQ